MSKKKKRRQHERDDAVRARLSAFLVEWCKARGMSRQDLARKVGCDPSSVSRAVRGQNGQFDLYDKLAEPFGYEIGFVRRRRVADGKA